MVAESVTVNFFGFLYIILLYWKEWAVVGEEDTQLPKP